MGQVAERFDALAVKVLSPDKRIRGELCGRGAVELSFVDDQAYGQYRIESRLAAQVQATLNALFTARRDGQHAAIRELTDLSIDDSPHWDGSLRAYRTKRDSLVATGLSDDEYVSVGWVGMRDLTVTVNAGSLGQLDESAFLAETHSAVADLWLDWNEQLHELKQEHLGIPKQRTRTR